MPSVAVLFCIRSRSWCFMGWSPEIMQPRITQIGNHFKKSVVPIFWVIVMGCPRVVQANELAIDHQPLYNGTYASLRFLESAPAPSVVGAARRHPGAGIDALYQPGAAPAGDRSGSGR